MSQVLSKLLSNAARYTPSGGRVRVDGWLEGGQAVLRVTDTGIGIPPEAIGAIFDMFTQVTRSLERSKGGLGIGLSLVRHLVALRGGTVAAHSAGPGQGSALTVRQPLAAAGALPASAAGDGAPAPAGPLRILVAADNIDAADSLAALPGAGGHAVCTVYDGAEAMRRAAGFEPELAFLDIGMPGMDGYQLARALRGLPRLAGFDRHLLKPAAPGPVAAILAEARPAA